MELIVLLMYVIFVTIVSILFGIVAVVCILTVREIVEEDVLEIKIIEFLENNYKDMTDTQFNRTIYNKNIRIGFAYEKDDEM